MSGSNGSKNERLARAREAREHAADVLFALGQFDGNEEGPLQHIPEVPSPQALTLALTMADLVAAGQLRDVLRIVLEWMNSLAGNDSHCQTIRALAAPYVAGHVSAQVAARRLEALYDVSSEYWRAGSFLGAVSLLLRAADRTACFAWAMNAAIELVRAVGDHAVDPGATYGTMLADLRTLEARHA